MFLPVAFESGGVNEWDSQSLTELLRLRLANDLGRNLAIFLGRLEVHDADCRIGRGAEVIAVIPLGRVDAGLDCADELGNTRRKGGRHLIAILVGALGVGCREGDTRRLLEL